MPSHSLHMIAAAVLGCLVLAQLVPAMQLPAKRSNCVLLNEKPRPVVAKHHYSNCLLAQFGAMIRTQDGRYIELKDGVDCSPAVFKCQCGALFLGEIIDQHLTVDFPCGSLSIWIGHNSTSPAFVKQMDLEYQVNNETIRVSNNDGLFPIIDLDEYHRSESEQAIKMSGKKETALLLLSSLAIESYRTEESTLEFYKQPGDFA